MDTLPKTRSGKILRGTIRKIANNQEWKMPATIDDPTAMQAIVDAAAEWQAERTAAK
jgi:propionyl-CoA synthetase